ncbi:MAG: hypothetical protein SVV03_00400, partial [Candidatus Nanohaloarchaea archaeon]|nr:hypothetical protein [Candidatus Nanohaloarchaea archaeon]
MIWSYNRTGFVSEAVTVHNSSYIYIGGRGDFDGDNADEGLIERLDASGSPQWNYTYQSGAGVDNFINDIAVRDKDSIFYGAFSADSATRWNWWIEELSVSGKGEGSLLYNSSGEDRLYDLSYDDGSLFHTGSTKGDGQSSDDFNALSFETSWNQAPVFNSLSWNDSIPEYGEWVQLEANISDPDSGDSVTSVQLETERNGSTVFKGNGSKA